MHRVIAPLHDRSYKDEDYRTLGINNYQLYLIVTRTRENPYPP